MIFRIADIDWSIPAQRVDQSMSLFCFRAFSGPCASAPHAGEAQGDELENPCDEHDTEVRFSFCARDGGVDDTTEALPAISQQDYGRWRFPTGSEFYDAIGLPVDPEQCLPARGALPGTGDTREGHGGTDRQDASTDVEPVAVERVASRQPVCLMKGEHHVWFRMPDGGYRMHFLDVVTGAWRGSLDVDAQWRQAQVLYDPIIDPHGWDMAFDAGDALLRNRILFHGGLVVHASLVDWQGRGLLFSAPSQTGKTTQATLWKRHRGARLLNGDRTPLRKARSGYLAYGSPWSGATPLFENDHVQLHAIVLLEQAATNSVVPLTPAQAVPRLMPRVFLPYYDAAMMRLALDNLDALLTVTPVYLLRCTPDEDAVEALAACLT